mgnify:CR=1 FL=1
MARNLILGDPDGNKWCVYGQVGTIGDTPKHVLAFYKTKEDAEEAVLSLREKFEGQMSVRVFEYSYAKDELGLMKLMLLDGIHMAIQYLVA